MSEPGISRFRVWSFGPSRNDILPIAVEAAVAVVKAAATIMTPIGNPEHAFDGSHRAADAGADRAANHSAHRTGGPVTFVCALLRAAHDALRMPDLGDREQCERDGRDTKIQFCRGAGRQGKCRGLHLNSFDSAAMGRRDGYV